MNDLRRESPWRRVRECAFGLCTMWLVVQNALLLALLLLYRRDALSVALAALPKAVTAVLPLWVIPAAALCGLAIATTLARDAASMPERRRWEMEHGRTR